MSRKDKVAFDSSIRMVQRIANILKGAQVQGFNPEKLIEPQEKKLAEIFNEKETVIKTAVLDADFRMANRIYAQAFEKPVTDFFEKVMVNAEDPEVRKNRLGLLAEIRDLYTRNIADLSLLSRIDGAS